MSPAEQALEGATIDHLALSVGDLEAVARFYERLGFRVVTRTDFAPAPLRSALLRTSSGVMLELTEHASSVPASVAVNPTDAAQRQGFFHLALRVADVDAAVCRHAH